MIIEVNADPVIDRWFVNEWSTIKDNICINKRADVDAAMNGAGSALEAVSCTSHRHISSSLSCSCLPTHNSHYGLLVLGTGVTSNMRKQSWPLQLRSLTVV